MKYLFLFSFSLSLLAGFLDATIVDKGPVFRDYTFAASENEMKDIHFILSSLANKTLPKLLKLKPTLERAGDRIDHLHPLRFLEYVFTDEELKVAVRNIKDRSFVWGDFFGGLKSSLQEETDRNNLSDEMIGEFCLNVNIEIDLV